MSDCLIWNGAKAGNGYGVTSHKGRQVYVHRLEAEKRFGPIPAGMVVAHTCDTPACHNPDHLVICTQRQNLADMKTKGRSATGAKHGSVTAPDSRAKGERVASAKLTAEQVTEIRRRYQPCQAGRRGDSSLSALSQEFGVGFQAIHKIVKRITWRHV